MGIRCVGSKARSLAAKPTNNGWAPLHFVVRCQDNEALKLMLSALGPKAQEVAAMPNSIGWTSLHYVVRNYSGKLNTEALKLVLSVLGPRAPEVAAKLNSDGGWTLLHYVACCQDNEALKLMLSALGPKAGALLKWKDKNGKTLEAYARNNKKHPNVLNLIQHAGLYLKAHSEVPKMPHLPNEADLKHYLQAALRPSATTG